jgi:hypothetical protein
LTLQARQFVPGKVTVIDQSRVIDPEMVGANECREYAMECRRLATVPNISIQRAAILMALAQSWEDVARQLEQYETILRAEGQ